MTEIAYPIVHHARILQITSAPGPLADKDGNIYAGYALCEFDFEWSDGTRATGRDILPYGTEGGIIVDRAVAYYALAALGDFRPPFAEFVDLEAAA
jgi:hypothetical protein